MDNSEKEEANVFEKFMLRIYALNLTETLFREQQ